MILACSGSFPYTPTAGMSEQLYLDAKLNFSIKHPLDWERIRIPPSAPEFRADTVRWKISNPLQKNNTVGGMLIRSIPGLGDRQLPDLLSDFLSGQPELEEGQVQPFSHPAGTALRLIGHDVVHTRLIIALKGQRHDFIISFDLPLDNSGELLPLFEEVIESFNEVRAPEDHPSSES